MLPPLLEMWGAKVEIAKKFGCNQFFLRPPLQIPTLDRLSASTTASFSSAASVFSIDSSTSSIQQPSVVVHPPTIELWVHPVQAPRPVVNPFPSPHLARHKMSAKRTGLPPLAPIAVRQSPRVTRKHTIDESRTAVTTGLTTSKSVNGTVVLEDDHVPLKEAASDEDDEEESEDETPADARPSRTPQSNGKDKTDADTQMADAKAEETPEQHDGPDAEPTSPTFGDLMRGSSTVDVSSALATQTSTSVTRANPQRALAAPVTTTSLGTVLNQALRTDDTDLLESCLQINDFKIIQNTIHRMDSALAAVLLSKLADRMHRRPGRAFGLMRWMQWTLVAHGGTLVTQPNLLAQLEKLNRVLEERARALPSLLALRGKLDMLDAQMKHRKAIKKANNNESDDPDEPGVVYVEGQETAGNGASLLANGTGSTTARGDQDLDFGVNGFQEDSDDSEEEDVDDMAEELADVESMDEDEVVHDDVEDESGDDMDEQDHDDDDDEIRAPPSKVQKTAAKGSAGRK